jgi:phosphotransferase system HPr (HPr) family protein
MEKSEVTIQWEEGLHLRPAASLVRMGQSAKSSILIKSGNKVANIKSIMSIMMLCATMGTTLTIEATGEDEQEITQKLEAFFSEDK